MTILSQAETIRDETVVGANTAGRVGDCLVDIANAITALQPAYCFASGTSSTDTVIGTSGQFSRIVIDQTDLDGNGAFTVSNDCVLTCVEPGAYELDVVMSIAIVSGTHEVLAVFGSGSWADDGPVFQTTLTGGISAPAQLCMKMIRNISAAETVAIWVTDNTHNHDILVSKVAIVATRISTLGEG